MNQRASLVVVPACNEELTIGACLDALRLAVEEAQHKTETLIVVVCDSCEDATYDEAERSLEGLRCVLVRVNYRNVGMSRDWGARVGLHLQPETEWIAFTDADTCVKPDWLKLQIACLDYGFDAFFGRVDFDGDNVILANFKHRYDNQKHRYIHGANMGLRKSAFDAVGGLPHLTAHEDRVLVERLEERNLKVLWDERAGVHTSTRMIGRAPEGFAATLKVFADGYTATM